MQKVGADVAIVSEQTYSVQGLDIDVFKEKPHFSDEEWDTLCQGLNRLGKIAGEYGLDLTFHHHLGTGVQTAEEVDRLMDGTDPRYVHLLYDTGHAYISDGDYMTILNKHMDRIRHVHFKDARFDIMERCRQEGKSFRQSFLQGILRFPATDASILPKYTERSSVMIIQAGSSSKPNKTRQSPIRLSTR